jgi:beta-glucanase (GH16 family)
MMPVTNTYGGGWPRNGEIDIMEMIGHRPNHSSGTLHMAATWMGSGLSHFRGVDITFEEGRTIMDWNVYGMVWTPTHMHFLLNNKLARSIRLADLPRGFYEGVTVGGYTDGHPFRHEFFLVLNLALDGGRFGGEPSRVTDAELAESLPAYMEVDWVRAYTLENDPWPLDVSTRIYPTFTGASASQPPGRVRDYQN